MPRKANLLPFDLVQQISKGDLSLDVLKVLYLSLFQKMKRELCLVFFSTSQCSILKNLYFEIHYAALLAPMQMMMENLKSFFNDFLGWFRHIHGFIQRTKQKKNTREQIDSYLPNKKLHYYSGQKSEINCAIFFFHFAHLEVEKILMWNG